MKNIVSGTDMKKVDKYTIDTVGIPSIVLMERAALAVADRVSAQIPKNSTVVVAAGVGNNGADGVAAGRMLFLRGYKTSIFLVGDEEKATKEFATQIGIARNLGIPEVSNVDGADVLIDAMFGVGLSRDISGKYAKRVEDINKSRSIVYAVDIPSGIDADTGKVMGSAVNAVETITFGCHKMGTVFYPGAECCGKVSVADIGLPQISYNSAGKVLHYAQKDDLKNIPKRANYSNKGTFGKILIVAGSSKVSGAAYMCAAAAFRMGAGLVRIYTHEANRQTLQRMLPESLINTYTEESFDPKALEACLKWCDVVAAGPGISTGDLQEKIIEQVLAANLPTVLDADGINNIARDQRLLRKLHKKVIITPHLLEMGRLFGVDAQTVADDIVSYAEKIPYMYNCSCILKDARTVSATEEGTYVNLSGNNGMATAGSGDVLTGITAGLIGVGTNINDAAFLAPYIHGLAGDLAAKEKSKASMMATDIIANIGTVLDER